jgi:exocyst complex component 2
VQLEQTIHRGVIGDGVDWYNAPKPTEVHPYIYDVLLSLVLVHAQVTAIARSLVTRTVGALVEEIAKHALTCFSQVRSYGMGGMLQATLEMEFLHQTLNVHVSPAADATLQEIYKIISQAYAPPPNGDGSSELQRELEQLKMTLTQARRATALQFLCFREKRPQAVTTNSGNSANNAPPMPSGARTR